MKDTHYLDARVADAYDAEHAGQEITTADIPFYAGLAKEAAAFGQGVLELACGTGRVTLAIANAGVRITGLDSSPAMLEIARRKGSGDNPRWVEADMRSFELDERFGLAIIPFRSFLHLLTVEDQKACLKRIHGHLLPGARLALNFFNSGMLREPGPVISRIYSGMRLRYVQPEEMQELLTAVDFEVEALYGWFDGRPFTDESTEMVWTARRLQPHK